MTQHTLWRKHHQGLAPRAKGLPPQKMEVLRRARGLADLEVIHRGELQKPLDARAGVFWSLTFVAVRQQHYQAGEKAPFSFPSNDELIDDGLRNVGEIAELCFPKNQRLWKITAVAVFEAKHPRFRQGGIV